MRTPWPRYRIPPDLREHQRGEFIAFVAGRDAEDRRGRAVGCGARLGEVVNDLAQNLPGIGAGNI